MEPLIVVGIPIVAMLIVVGVVLMLWEEKARRVVSAGLGNKVVRNMKCPNCGFEVRAEDKFCGKCGKPLRHETEMAPIWKWGSMIASLVLIFIFWVACIYALLYEVELLVIKLIILLIFGFPATIYLMYKERTEKMKYGLAWILFPLLILLLSLGYWNIEIIFLGFLVFVLPAIAIDVIYVYKTR